MINMAILQEVRKYFSSKDIFLLTSLINKLEKEKPYLGLRIIYNAHMTLSSLLQIEALVASGAEVITTIGDGLRCDPLVIETLRKANVPFIPFNELQGTRCDFALDCCAKLLGRIQPTYGVVELTQTGVVKYSNTKLDYPVISVDDTKVKTIETLFGTGDGFVRGFRQAVHSGLHHKKFVLFGYGKVGQGIVRALSGLTEKIIIIEQDKEKVQEAILAGCVAYSIADKEIVQRQLAEAFCVVTATGEKGMISSHFERHDITAKYLANMGSEDEWGDKFSVEDVLNKKSAINFCLEQPTRVLFLDPIFYAQNTALDILLKQNLTKKVHAFPPELDLEILSAWIANHYQINLEGDYLQSIIRNIPCFIYWKDRDSVYQGCNDQFAKAAGFEKMEEVVGKTDYELAWGQTEAEIYRKGDQEAFEGKTLLNIEETQKQAQGRQSTVLASKVPFHDNDGNIIGVLGIYTDITERKHQEEELKTAKEAAETANQAKTEFLENMRHDIRTPLAGVSGFANILMEEVADPKLKEYLHSLKASADAILVYMNEVMESVRIASGEVPLNKNKFDLRERLENVIHLNQAKAEQKHLELLFYFDSYLPKYFVGDSMRVHRIVLELVTNALNFTSEGTIKVAVYEAKKENHDVIIKIIVSDTGIGIPLEKQQEIFQRFKRLHPSYQGIYKGAGLGLAVLKQYIDDLEGEVYVESTLGKGSTFTCVIPLKIALLDEKEGVEVIQEPSVLESLNTDIISFDVINSIQKTAAINRILVVEDDAIAAKMAIKYLLELECEVDIATNGMTAVKLAEQNRYDLIFMDIGLPDIDGIEVTKQIRIQERNRERPVPIIALTAHVENEARQRCIDVGMSAVLSKPFDKQKARQILDGFIPLRTAKKQIADMAQSIREKETKLLNISGEIINYKRILELSGGNEDVKNESLRDLIASFPKRTLALTQAYEKKDWKEIAELAHEIKGNSLYCAAERMEKSSANLENYLRTQNSGEFKDQLYQLLLTEMDAVKQEISKNKC